MCVTYFGGYCRFVEWMDCCCSGTEMSTQDGGYEDHLLFPVVSAVLPCRDTLLQHPRTTSCDLLSKMSSSVPLDSGYAYLFLYFLVLLYPADSFHRVAC